MSADPRIVYGADRYGTPFGLVDAEHPGGHHGTDIRLPAGGGSEVVAYTECTVVECGVEVTKGFTAVLGWYLVARTPLGRYLGWAHLRRGTRAKLGKVLKPGDLVGLAASGPRPKNYQSPEVAADDYPGTAWTAAHIHTTNGSTITSIFSGVGLIDPLPGIRAALASLASGGIFTPIATTPQEEDMPTANEITQELRNAVWLLGPNGEQLRVEQALKDIATRQQTIVDLIKGYGARTQDLHVNLVPAILTRLAADSGHGLTDVELAQLAGALAPQLVSALGKDVATGTQLAALRTDLLGAIAQVDENTLATFGLKRA